jgi:hypothetical protein
MNTQLLIDRLRSELPPVFTRKTASRLTGGYIAAGTLANLDSKGTGPGGVLAGKATLYEREAFLTWLEQRIVDGGAKAPRQQTTGQGV